MIGYSFDGDFISQEDALELIYYKSYEQHFENNPEDLNELIRTAKVLINPHSKLTGGIDLQVPAIVKYLERNSLKLQGNEVVEIGTALDGHRNAQCMSAPVSERQALQERNQ